MMVRSRFQAFTAFVVVLSLLIAGLPATAHAQSSGELSGTTLEHIARNCSSAQVSLQQLQKRDAVSRINRGRAYDLMLRQVSALNSRFAYNKINVPTAVELASGLQTHINQFRTNYDRYDNDLDAAIDIDCKSKPADFYSWIVKARDDRASVSAEISQIESLSTRYRQMVVTYQQTLKQPAAQTESGQ